MSENEGWAHISHLDRREVQAPLVASMINAFCEAFGTEEALAVAQKVIREDAVRSGRALAREAGGNSLQDLMKVVENVWGEDGTMELENVRLDDGTLSFDVTKCGYAEMYKRLGLEELGSLMSCYRDFPFQDGFNPAIRLSRTTTIMEGGDRCDFQYAVKDSPTKALDGVVWDWGDTLMRNMLGQEGPMAEWPHVEAMPGAMEALSAFSALSEMRVQCIATNAGDSTGPMVAAALGRVGLANHLSYFFTSGEMGVEKPDSAFFEIVSSRLGVEPSKLLAVGNDLRKDILPAKAIGMTTVLVRSKAARPQRADPDRSGRAEEGSAGAAESPFPLRDPSPDRSDYTVSDLNELAAMVRGGLFGP